MTSVVPAIPEDAGERARVLREWTLAQRQAVLAEHGAGRITAVEAARRIAAAAEQLALVLFARAMEQGGAAAAGEPVALVALGGLGRRELAPHSDLDLVVVSPRPEAPLVRDLADRFFYPLWDARLEVGHGVRSPKEFARLAAQDDTVRTTAVDWRPLAGDPNLVQELARQLTQVVRSQATRRFVLASIQAWTHEPQPATVYRLEPNIKTGPGGLRELHHVWWMTRLGWRIETWEDLLTRGLVDRHDFEALQTSREVLLGIRLALHALSGRRQDVLRFDLQDAVARHLRLGPGAGDRQPADVLLESFYRHAKALRTAATHVLEHCAESLAPPRRSRVREVDGFHLFRGQLTTQRAEQMDQTPLDMLRIFRVAQRQGCSLHARVRTRIAHGAAQLLTPELCKSPEAARIFLDILSDTRDCGGTLELMHELGVLERLVPEFAKVTGLVQRDTYHTYTVDAHLLYCARRTLELFAQRVPEAPPVVQAAAEHVGWRHVVVLAALMHDVGKGYGHGHAERGAGMVQQAATRLGFDAGELDDVVFLVRQHLEMFKISQRRDLEDAALIARFASEVESRERLDALLVLSYADATTTGPAAWSDWKGSLLVELHRRTLEALRSGVAQQSLASRAAVRLRELDALLPVGDTDLRDLAVHLSPRHLVAHSAELLARHLRALQQAGESGAACFVEPEVRRGGWEIVVVGPDRPGLLASLTAVLAASGVSIDAAHISGTFDGRAIDTFAVAERAALARRGPEARRALAVELEAALLGRTDSAARLRERRRAAEVLASGAPLPEKRVVYDPDAATDATVLDVFAPDRVGLLHDIAEAIHAAGASIALARITTEGERAIDAFYVTESIPGRPLDASRRRAVEAAILEVL